MIATYWRSENKKEKIHGAKQQYWDDGDVECYSLLIPIPESTTVIESARCQW
jgi:hypothetical protein